ncbi:MAG: thioredoxin [Lachnospiraceae bacterium]|nr:thioredoxin [Lachnospiraceae bacterium]MDD3660433.1 thioredoxin [Lachnospiraceae bacterium]
MATIIGTNENFKQEVLESEIPVLVDFWAQWCGPCRMMHPVLEEISEEENIKIIMINVDEQPELAEQFNIMTIPTLMLFKNGKMVVSSSGAKPKNVVLNMLNQDN